ncbi:hypothetical protein KF728_23130 [Candidatus Obscuribacterales bacterium]|nr:hypothetical protein [Candidatus Obscuribacterales bacterium]MBX3153073.1 hypothetical protein [Candidatus Obscuribacterales bacterium]
MDAKQIIDAMRANYLRCTSYEDRGSVSIVTRTLARDKILNGSFSSTFIRPNLLRFELTTEEAEVKRRFMLQSDGDSVRAFAEYTPDVRPVQTFAFDSFKGAIQTVAGITDGVTNTVLSLLGEINPKWAFLNASTFQRSDDEVIEAVPCYKIEFVIDPFVANEGTAWVSIDSFTLRRLEERTVYTQEFRALALEQTKMFLEAEGISQNEEDRTISLTSIISFAEVTFNNSISIDKITDHRF